MVLSCPAGCGFHGASLEHHYVYSPHCKPPDDDGPPPEKRRRDPAIAAHLFANRVAATLGKAFLRAHVDHYLTYSDLDLCRTLSQLCAKMACDFIEQELGQLGCPPGSAEVFQHARAAFSSLPAAGALVEQRRAVYMRAEPRHLSTSSGDKKGAAFFNAHTLMTIMLQESAIVRKHVIESSNLWKTGTLYKTRPAIMTDVTQGTRFLDWHAVCGKAGPGEENDLRVLFHGWTDEFTPIDGLSQKARAHKYGVVLVAPVNLPLRLRHYADHVLLLMLYNCRQLQA
jgi:hypothetical protein